MPDVPTIRRRTALAATFALTTLASAPAGAQARRTLTWGKEADIDGMDVQVTDTVASWELYQLVYETLLTTDKDMALRPGLADSWKQVSPTRYTLTLRAGARWSNGRAVVADDVVGSLQRLNGQEMNPAGVAAARSDADRKKASSRIESSWALQLGEVTNLRALDDRTVQVDLARPHTAFLAALAHISAAILPMKELRDGSFDPTRRLLGSGPFMVAEYKPRERWILVRNPYYWRAGFPKADRLVVSILPDEASRLAALRDGRIDFSMFSNPDIARLVGNDRRLVVSRQETTNYFRMDLNAVSPKSPFHDKRVRQAADLAIDRQLIADLVFAGTARPDTPVPRAFGKTACQDLDTVRLPRPARLDKARQLMAATGRKRVAIEIVATTGDAVFARIAQVIQQNLREVGIDAKILQLPVAEALDKVFTRGDFDANLSWLAGYSDPSMVVAWWNPKFAVWNSAFQAYVPALADSLEVLKAAPAGPPRDEQLASVCRQIADTANILPLVSKVDFVVHRADRMDIRLDPVTGSSNAFQYIAEFAPLK